MKFASVNWWRVRVVPFVLATLLAAGCSGGGGGGSGEPEVPSTPLPAELVVTGPAGGVQQVGQPITFGQNVDDTAGKLSYSWSFGDGATSADPNPSHTFNQAGSFDVKLTVTNEVGDLRQATLSLQVAHLELVQGLLCSKAEQHGWCWKEPLPQGEAINSFYFVDESTAFAVGGLGAILRTTDGGATWARAITGTQSALRKVVFLDALNGAVAGDNELLLTTADGGNHWTAQQLPPYVYPETLKSLGGTTLWIGATSSLYSALISTDAGKTWRPYGKQPVSGACSSGPIQALSETEAWCLGVTFPAAVLDRSTDSGGSWTSVPLPALEEGLFRQVLSFSASVGKLAVLARENGYTSANTYVVRQRLYLSSTAGASWLYSDVAAGAAVSFVPYNSVEFSDAQRGILRCGFVVTCVNLITDDGGRTWNAVGNPPAQPSSSVDPYFYYLSRFGFDLLAAQGSEGKLLLSNDAGASWRDFSVQGTGSALSAVWFFNAQEGMVVPEDYGPAIRRTSDGGKTWTVQSFPGSGFLLGPQFLKDASVGWTVTTAGEVYRSTDRGQTWMRMSGPFQPTDSAAMADFHFLDANNGWMVAGNGVYGSTIFRTSDSGVTWSAVSGIDQALSSVHFGDPKHGVATSFDGQVLVTQDGGASWEQRATGTNDILTKAKFLDATTVVALGVSGQILRSVDAGWTWSKAAVDNPQPLRDVQFLSPLLGYAVGDAGAILRTSDAGATWLPVPGITERNLRSVFFTDTGTGWVAGENGTLLVTAFGGE